METIKERINTLMKMGRAYNKMSAYKDNELSKTFNRNMGNQKFIEVVEGRLYYNKLITTKRDLKRIKEVFPEFELVGVDLPYWSHSSLNSYYNDEKQRNVGCR